MYLAFYIVSAVFMIYVLVSIYIFYEISNVKPKRNAPPCSECKHCKHDTYRGYLCKLVRSEINGNASRCYEVRWTRKCKFESKED